MKTAEEIYEEEVGNSFTWDGDSNRSDIIDAMHAYAAQFQQEWVDAINNPPTDETTRYWQVATDSDVLLLPCEYYNGKWYAYTQGMTPETRVKWYKPLPTPPKEK